MATTQHGAAPAAMEANRGRVLLCYAGLVAVTLAAEFSPTPVPVYVHMMAVTMLVLYIGSYGSLVSNEKPQDEGGMERMSTKDAYMFPVWGSLVLFSLYLVFKFLPRNWVNVVVKGYFFVFGVLVLASNLHVIASLLLPKRVVARVDRELFRVRVPFFAEAPAKPSERAPADGSTIVSPLDVACYIVAAAVGVWYVRENHWSATNLFGIAFSIQGIEMLSLGSYLNGCILLGGLFLYDVFWVFGTDVMVTVAKSFDAPIKLLFPRAPGERPSMLGLGDIVIPGIFVALMLRFDEHRRKAAGHARLESPFYFRCVMIGYFVGLSTTVFVMYWFDAAQPALLYLVPACLGSTTLPALFRGELKDLVGFKEDEDDEDEEDEVEDDDTKKDK